MGVPADSRSTSSPAFATASARDFAVVSRRRPVSNHRSRRAIRAAVEDALQWLPRYGGRRAEAPSLPTGRSGPSDELLHFIAVSYRIAHLAGQPPTEYVRQRLGVPRATLGRWIARAREKGFLGEATPRRPGEIGGETAGIEKTRDGWLARYHAPAGWTVSETFAHKDVAEQFLAVANERGWGMEKPDKLRRLVHAELFPNDATHPAAQAISDDRKPSVHGREDSHGAR